MNNVSVKFFIRTDRDTPDQLYPLYCQLLLRRVKKVYSLNIRIGKSQFRNQKVVRHTMAIQCNNLINSITAQVFTLTVNSNIEQKVLSITDYDPIFKPEKHIRKNDFYAFVNREIDLSIGRFKTNTIRNYKVQIAKLMEFQKELCFENINAYFLKSYTKFLIEHKNNRKITARKSIVFIKLMINRAIQEGIIDQTVFSSYKIDGPGQTTKERLTLQELKSLEVMYYSVMKQELRDTLKVFLFACFTGLRYQDLKALKYVDIANNSYIYINQQKTETPVRIDLSERAKKLISSEHGNGGKIFKVHTSQDINRKLKIIMRDAKIDKNISIHCARHTFASIASELGMDTLLIKQVLGHANIQTTLIYTKVSDDSARNGMMLFDTF